MWTVTRQRQWPDGDTVVEISAGGLDYANPDALAGRYPGEFEEFDDPREAVEAAIGIAEAWKADAPGEDIQIAHGGTGGFTMPFDGEELTDEAKQGLRDWANGVWEALPGCDQCGDRIAGDPVTLLDYDDWKFCSEGCAERWHEEQQEAFEGDEEGVEDDDDAIDDDDDAVEDEDEGPGEAGGGAPRASGAYHRVVRAFGAAPDGCRPNPGSRPSLRR